MRLANVVLVALIAVACIPGGPVDEIYVHNTSDRDWVIRYPIPYEGYEGMFWVSRIAPGADGVAGRWAKVPSPGAQIEVLGVDCAVVDSFSPTPGVEYIVPSAPGLRVKVTPWGSNMARWQTPEIRDTQECGGSENFQ